MTFVDPAPVSSGSPSPRAIPDGIHGFALGLLFTTLLLLLLGAMVKSTGSSLAVPDWPLSFGRVFPELKGGVFYEHIHRAVAATVALLTLGFALWLQFTSVSPRLKALAWLAFVLVIVQAILGGITVLAQLPPVYSVAHAATAQTFLALVTLLTVVTAPAWHASLDPSPRATHEVSPLIARSALRNAGLTFYLVVAQILLGVAFRHTGKLLHLHILVGVLVLVVAHLAFFSALKTYRPSTESAHKGALTVRTFARWLIILTSAQVLLGLFVYLIYLGRIAIPLMGFAGALIRSLHLWMGSLILLDSLCLWLWVSRSAQTAGRPVQATLQSLTGARL
ncbi:MAG: COX15/CtaA family protein [bacterium JZ-2024 1]